MEIKDNCLNRRAFLRAIGGGAAISALAFAGCNKDKVAPETQPESADVASGKMTYRKNLKGENISILGYGCMRLPTITGESARDGKDEIDQEMVNKQVDYAIAHGVNYFDTSPSYCQGQSEHAMGIALSRHSRDKYYIATKLSNFVESTWSREASLKIYNNSFKELQVDYIDYMLLHGIGMGEGMETLNRRYLDNGILDFLIKEREAGRIRNLGFSYHGDVKCFDYLLSRHQEIKWDFVQIQMNYVDWKHAKQVNPRNTNAEYLYTELDKRNIPVVIMEPLLGGRLANINNQSAAILKRIDPSASIASWAFRFAGYYPKVLTVLSGMTYMEHLKENIQTYSPLIQLSSNELESLEAAALTILDFPLVQCNTCQYCMPCPYGLDIPNIFSHYNKCLNDGSLPANAQSENYKKLRKAFLVGYDRTVPKLRQANHCIACNHCIPHCPQNIDIPKEMQRIDKFVETLKQNV